MKVKLKRTWFYPVDAKPANDRREISGGRLRKGTHEIDPELRPHLPKDAVILDEKADGEPVLVAPVKDEVQDNDLGRAAFDAEAKVLEEAEEARQATIKAKRQAALAKAREAKKAKKEAGE